MANQWFKMYGGEFLYDPKIQELSGDERSCWITILCLASTSTIEGKIEFLTLNSLHKMSGVRPITNDNENDNEVDVITKFQKLKMLRKNSDGSIDVINWNKRQERAMSPYERVKKYRNNKKIKGNDNEMITDDNANDNARIEENRIEENILNTNTLVLEKEKNNTKKKKDWKQDPEFFSFYQKYKNKIAPSKAYESWVKLSEEEKKLAMNAIEVQIKNDHFKGRDGKDYIPYPATWLNQKRWEDEVKIKKDAWK